jgi:membrane protease YdiL (CAAX protease family)
MNRNAKFGFAYIALAFILWIIVFAVKPFNFWITMSSAAFLLLIISVYEYRDNLSKVHWTPANIFIGILSGLLLAGIFYAGKYLLSISGVIPDYQNYIKTFFLIKAGVPDWLIILLLIFPIAAAEELFWRGCIMRYYMEMKSNSAAFWITAFSYTFVHLITFNPVLILAAFTAGLFWGSLYLWRKSVIPGIISHIIFDILVFVLLPL